MNITGLNHFNLAVADLERSARFYEALGLRRGHRPEFPTRGIWLYCGDAPVLHLNDAAEVGVGPYARDQAAVHHVGLSARGSVDDVTDRLSDLGVIYDLWDPIPGVCRALYFRGPDDEYVELVLVDCPVTMERAI
jgi:catechol 2,3-dioxygenase-like lactoylglutathione lyase family enzyme